MIYPLGFFHTGFTSSTMSMIMLLMFRYRYIVILPYESAFNVKQGKTPCELDNPLELDVPLVVTIVPFD